MVRKNQSIRKGTRGRGGRSGRGGRGSRGGRRVRDNNNEDPDYRRPRMSVPIQIQQSYTRQIGEYLIFLLPLRWL